jgi:hypothetical protein
MQMKLIIMCVASMIRIDTKQISCGHIKMIQFASLETKLAKYKLKWQTEADDRMFKQMAIQQGYVPTTCTLPGTLV